MESLDTTTTLSQKFQTDFFNSASEIYDLFVTGTENLTPTARRFGDMARRKKLGAFNIPSPPPPSKSRVSRFHALLPSNSHSGVIRVIHEVSAYARTHGLSSCALIELLSFSQ